MMAYDLLVQDEAVDEMQRVADSIASKHIMFATSKIFEDMYVNEIAYWVEGMPFDMYNEVPQKGGITSPLPAIVRPKTTRRIVSSDIPVIGDKGLKILDDVGVYLMGGFEGCIGCEKCAKECPERALVVLEGGALRFTMKIATEHCLGTACKNCESVCPEKVYRFSDLKVTERSY